MLDSTVEFVSEATSNFHLIFCFCNIIIVLLLIDRYKSDLNCTRNSSDFLQIVVTNGYDNYTTLVENDHVTEGSFSESAKPDQNNKVGTEAEDNTEEEEEDDDDRTNEEDEVTEGDDGEYNDEAEYDDVELKRRVEEFINKTRREWQAERLRLSSRALC